MKNKQADRATLKKLFDTIKRDGLIAHGENVLVAFSGGADSVALLLMLHELQEKLNIKLFAAHLNHGIRGAEADRDERFCAELCEKNGIPIDVGHVSVPSEAARTGEGLEECARRLRYAFLNECAEKLGCTKIATAHHADDNIETVLLHLIRGTGPSGLVGISPKRGNLIRPLLRFRKRELTDYLDAIGQSYVVDSTNSDTTMTRNKIRHKLLDTVYEINPKADTAFSGMSSLIEEDNKYLISLAEAVDKNATLRELSGLALPVLSRFLQIRYAQYVNEKNGTSDVTKCRPAQLSHVNISPITEFIKTGTGNADFTLPGKVTVHVSARGVEFSCTEKTAPEYYEIPLKLGENNISQCGYKILITNDKNVADEWQNIYKLSIPVSVKSGTILCEEKTGLYVRAKKTGDEYVYGGHTRSVRRRLIDLKIPAYERSRIPCICDSEGIIFVPYLRAADRVKPEKGQNMLYLICADTEKLK